jgi:hypothetical protein
MNATGPGGRSGRQVRAIDGPGQEGRFRVDVLHDGQLPVLQDTSGYAFTVGVHAARHLLRRESVCMANPARATVVVEKHDAPPVQAEQLGHQMQHLAQHGHWRKVLAHQRHYLLEQ